VRVADVLRAAIEQRWDGIPAWITDAHSNRQLDFWRLSTGGESLPLEGVLLMTPEGVVMSGDSTAWIIRGEKGELYPCQADVFERTYESVPAKTPEEAAARAPYERLIGRLRNLEQVEPSPGWQERAALRWHAEHGDIGARARDLYATHCASAGGIDVAGGLCARWDDLTPGARCHWYAVALRALQLEYRQVVPGAELDIPPAEVVLDRDRERALEIWIAYSAKERAR